MTDETELCGEPTTEGQPCQKAATRADDRCHLHTEVDTEDGGDLGRPPKLDDVYDDVMAAAEEGLTYEGIARVAGVGRSTLDDWRRENDEFSAELERRRSVGERKLIQEADAEFVLERSYEYTKEQDINIDADVDGQHDVTADFVTYTADTEDDGGSE